MTQYEQKQNENDQIPNSEDSLLNMKPAKSSFDNQKGMRAQDMQLTRERVLKDILRHEQIILAACNFQIDISLVNPYVDRYMKLMYPTQYNAHNQCPLRTIS